MSKRANHKKKSTSNNIGFKIVFNKWQRENFNDKSREILYHATKYTSEELAIINKDYRDINSQIIGSMISTLIYKACRQPKEYYSTRYEILKETANFIKENNAYVELYEFIKAHHNMAQFSISTSGQVMQELIELIGMITPFNMELIGLNDRTPIYVPSKFPYTMNFVGKVNNLPPENKWSKKEKNIVYENYARSTLTTFYNETFGLYNTSIIDMVPQNSINLAYYEKDMILPRELHDTDYWISLIRKNRKYIINKNGIVIDCYNAGDIETIFMVESKGFLLYKVILSKNGWVLNNSGNLVDDINGGEYCGIIDLTSLYSDSEYVYTYSYYELITEYIEKAYNILNFVIECYADVVCGSNCNSENKKVNSSDKILFDNDVTDNEIEQYFKEKGFVGIRTTPRSLYSIGERTSSRTSKQTRTLFFVEGHLRLLPSGSNASEEAINKAAEYGITVPKGYTFVTPYYAGLEQVRSYYKKIVNN